MANCASCAHQRRICPEGCVMAPHFPRTRTREFQLVNGVFGVSNAIEVLKDLDFSQQKEAVEAMIWEAEAWEQDPICGPLGLYERFEEQILILEEDNRMLEEETQMLGGQNPVIQERGFDLETDNGHIHVQQQNVVNPSFVQDLERERNHGARGFHHHVLQEQERGNNSGRQTILQQQK
ncbi:LOB domain-containing protein 35-like [Actinidia eriantha]|uniref:LOB domain-containing protein 35-like n=1 Tax=Actinidia eriantha TaxID=165200 RepID=UPI002589895A|nr:LOB domain-containing protein 35-like [Actinidia eriantha]